MIEDKYQKWNRIFEERAKKAGYGERVLSPEEAKKVIVETIKESKNEQR